MRKTLLLPLKLPSIAPARFQILLSYIGSGVYTFGIAQPFLNITIPKHLTSSLVSYIALLG